MNGNLMKLRSSHTTLFLALFASYAWSQEPPLMVYNRAKLASAKKTYLDRSEPTSSAVKKLFADADKALKQEPVTVTSKKQTPPSGDKRDYMSMAPYWWPDPTKKDGLPYIRKDGQVNPERNDFKDRELVGTLQSCITTLGAAYYISGKDEYAAHASKMLHVWFLDSATRMNPNMNFSEAIKGRNNGRGAGIIGFSQLPTILDGLVLIRGSKHWTAADDAGIAAWCKSYLTWLRTSPNGIDEQDAPNNHGTWYEVQVVGLCIFTGIPDTAKRILEAAKAYRIASQIEPDGRMPLELARTRGLHYGTFNLQAMAMLANMASHVGVDLWHHESADGRSIRKAIDWMQPYYLGTKKWEFQQITEWNPDDAVGMLTMAGFALGNSYSELAAKIAKSEATLLRARLLF
jgi:hypothetical protein